MKRSLLTQIRNEWKDNVWMMVELAVVVAAVWVIMALLYVFTNGLFTERGFNPEDVYTFQIRKVQKSSPEFVQTGDTTGEYIYSDRAVLMQRLREHPDVEAVALSRNAIPYNFNYYGNMVSRLDRPDSIYYFANVRIASPEIVKVLGIKSLTGMSQDKLVEILEKGGMLVSDNKFYVKDGRDPFDLNGKEVILGNDSTRTYRVGDVVAAVRRNDYEPARAGVVICPIDENKDWASELAVRVKPGRGDSFKAAFRADKSLQRLRNIYFTDIKSLMDLREANQRSTDTTVRMFVVVMGFLMVTIFLGLLGTFWFRMQQRVGEIAIRKVCGARKSDILRRILGEGMIILLCAVVIASALIWPFSGYGVDSIGLERYEILIFEVVAIAFVAIVIVLSVLWPARKAMAIEPAIAIKDE